VTNSSLLLLFFGQVFKEIGAAAKQQRLDEIASPQNLVFDATCPQLLAHINIECAQ
jgi:hypothetical protein